MQQVGRRCASEEVLLLVLVNDIACDALLGGDLQVAAIAGKDIGCPVDQHGQAAAQTNDVGQVQACLLYTSPSTRDRG